MSRCPSVSGRSRLHLLDLGSCETDISRTREGGAAQCLSLSALGNVILALSNGAKHVPYRYQPHLGKDGWTECPSGDGGVGLRLYHWVCFDSTWSRSSGYFHFMSFNFRLW